MFTSSTSKTKPMKKITLLLIGSLFMASGLFAQVTEGDLQLVQKYFGAEKMTLVKDYLNTIANANEAKATELVDRSNANEIAFKQLQKKYYSKMAKTIGPVKAAQFYQFENYINNIINLSIQEAIPFVGELEQKHEAMPKKK